MFNNITILITEKDNKELTNYKKEYCDTLKLQLINSCKECWRKDFCWTFYTSYIRKEKLWKY